MLTLAQQRNLRDRQRNYRNPLRWADCALQATRTHRQFGAHFTLTTMTEEAMRRDRRSLRHVFRETVCVPNSSSSSAGRRSAHCRGRRSDMSIRTPTHFTESIQSGGSFNELFKSILIQNQVHLLQLHILPEAVKCALLFYKRCKI